MLFAADAAAQERQECDPVVRAACAQPDNIAKWDLYLSGYAYHHRGTYSDKRLKKLNEKAWGAGLGRTLRNARGNDESLYLMAIRDSNERPQWMAGYAYQWVQPVFSGGLEAGVGLTALLIKREDWFDGRPFPALLPVASLGPQHGKLLMTYVPRISVRGKGKGNVLLFAAKFSF
jgi:palmitoyl transferase